MPNIYQRIIFGKNKKYGLFRRITIVLLMSLLSSVCRLIAVPTLPFSWHLYTFFVFTAVLMLIWECFRFINKFLDKKLPYEKGILKRIITQLLLGIILISNLRKIWVYWFISFAPKEIMDLIPLNTMMIYMFYFIDILISVLINANFIVLHFFEEWQKSLIKNERLQKERAQVQFDNLRNQVNPHFLFNSLTALNSLIFENPKLASDFLQHLSRVYRYVLQHKDKGDVALETELDFIRRYLFLLETKFGKSLQVKMEVDDELLDRKIVPVTLQILIENAVKHNTLSEENPLFIRVYTDEDCLCVENNINKRNLVETSNRMGLENLRALYGFISGKPLKVFQDERTFKVCVPLI